MKVGRGGGGCALRTRRDAFPDLGAHRAWIVDQAKHIDPKRSDADLADDSGSAQILLGEVLQRRAEFQQGSEGALRVGRLGPHPDNEIACCPDPAVRRQGVGADDQVFNAVGVEFGQQIFEVGAQPGRLPAWQGIAGSVPKPETFLIQVSTRPWADPASCALHRAGSFDHPVGCGAAGPDRHRADRQTCTRPTRRHSRRPG